MLHVGCDAPNAVHGADVYFADPLILPSDRGALGAAVYARLAEVLSPELFGLLHNGLRYKPFVFHMGGVLREENGRPVLEAPVLRFRSLLPECADAVASGRVFCYGGQKVRVAGANRYTWENPWVGRKVVLGLRRAGWVTVSRPEDGRKRCVFYDRDGGAFVFADLVAGNLSRKAAAVDLRVSPGDVLFAFDPDAVRRAKRHGAKIFVVNGGKVIAYRLPGVLVCPGDLVPVVLGCGLGERNAQGFGFVEIAGGETIG